MVRKLKNKKTKRKKNLDSQRPTDYPDYGSGTGGRIRNAPLSSLRDAPAVYVGRW